MYISQAANMNAFSLGLPNKIIRLYTACACCAQTQQVTAVKCAKTPCPNSVEGRESEAPDSHPGRFKSAESQRLRSGRGTNHYTC